MSCETGIFKAITSDCSKQPIGGLEVNAWLFNRMELVLTFDNTNPSKITDLVTAAATKGYLLKGVKKLLNAGHSVVVADDRADRYTHKFDFQGFEFDTASVEGLDQLADLVVVVEAKNKIATNDGTFVAYGVKSGLFKTTDERMFNDVGGARKISLATRGGEEEVYSNYTILKTDYATTKAMLTTAMSVPA